MSILPGHSQPVDDAMSLRGNPSLSNSYFHEKRWLLFALALFLLQVLPYLSYRWVTDESWYAAPGYSIAQGHGLADPAIGPNDIENRFDARPPGTALVIAGFFRAFGVGAIQARIGSVLAGLLVVFLTYRLTRDILGEEGALFAALITATDNLLVATSRTARPEALTTAAVFLSLCAMKRYAAPASSLPWAFLSGLLLAAATMFHITVAGYLVSFGLLAIVIDHWRNRPLLRGIALYAVGFFTGLAPFAAWILGHSLGPQAFREEYLSRAGQNLWTKLLHEGHRYSDLIGLHMLHGLENLPARLPIPLCFIVASVLLWKYSRRWFYLELLLLLPTVFWFIYTVNKSSRYLALLAPIFGIVMGAAIAATRNHPQWRKACATAAALIVLAQFGANLLLLRTASKANYTQVATRLRTVIPAGDPVYGTITFWLAFHDHPYISHERTTPEVAATQDGVRYFVLGDRMMAQGDDWDAEFYQKMRKSLADLQIKGVLIGHFPDPYYGDLKVYKLPPQTHSAS